MTFQVCLLLLLLSPQEPKPLPEEKAFIDEFRQTLRPDDKLLSQYTYTEKETEITLDSKGTTKKSKVNVYQILHSAEEWKTYRRQITKDGVPLTAKDLEKQDRQEKERVARETHKRGNQSEAQRQQEKAKADRKEREIIDDVFSMYDVQLVRREAVGGVSVILATFKTKANYKPKTREGKILQHIAGRAWIAEDDHELARLEAEIIDPISIGAGLLAKLNKGSMLAFERRKINNEIWLPVRVDASLSGRMFLMKGLNIHDVTEYVDHRKYSVDTILNFGDVVPPANRQ
jgi:hypothetical protein